MSWQSKHTLLFSILTLAQAMTFFMHEVPAVSKTPLVWAHGLLVLTLLFHFSQSESLRSDNAYGARLRQKLGQFNVSPATYSYLTFCKLHAVYVKFEVDLRYRHSVLCYRQPSPMLYVGSTSVGAAKRDMNRMAVYRRMSRTKCVDAELALRYWHSHGNLSDYCTIVLATCASYRDAWCLEHSVISEWQPWLNYPWACKVLKKTALGFRHSSRHRAGAYARFGLRLWRKLRKRLHGQRRLFTVSVKRKQAWELLYDLASFTRQSFEAAKSLRSYRFVDTEVYAIIRLSNALEQPSQSRVRRLLRGVARHRNMVWPRRPTALPALFLSHSDFSAQLKRWLSVVIQQYKWMLPPFHVPRPTVREIPHQSLKNFLQNFKHWEQRMNGAQTQPEQLPCCCHEFSSRLPASCFVHGHIACGIEELAVAVPSLQPVSSGSAASTIFPGKHFWMREMGRMFSLWRTRNGLPATLSGCYASFLEEQWSAHRKALESTSRLHWALVHKAKSALDSRFVVYNEDHHPNHLVVYCPRHYCRAVVDTWCDPQVFTPLDGTEEYWQSQTVSRLPHTVTAKYSWGVSPQALLPKGTVFLKRKKQFLKGRTIISYRSSLLSKLLAAASLAITSMLESLWPNAPGLQSMPKLWGLLHQFLREAPVELELCEWNDDLIGFFNNVPRHQIIDALRSVVQQFFNSFNQVFISVDIVKKQAHLGKPRARRTTSFKVINIFDLECIIQASFETGIFTAAGGCWVQHQGTCIGNQISPVLSNLPVLLTVCG